MIHQNGQDFHRKELVRLISLYRVLEFRQVARLFPDLSENALSTMLTKLKRQGRISMQGNFIYCCPCLDTDEEIIAAFDVLLDFFPEVVYHSPGEYPVKLTFFAKNEVFDVICVSEGKETLITHALSSMSNDSPESQKLVILSSLKQIGTMNLSRISAYCLVSDGEVQYIKKQGV